MIWKNIKEKLSVKLPDSAYSMWIEPLTCVKEEHQVLELAGPDTFFCNWVMNNYLGQIKDCLKDLSRSDLEVNFVVNSSCQRPLLTGQESQLRLPTMPKVQSTIRTLHPRHTFEEFMVGECNMVAHGASAALAQNDTSLGNCLYIKSGTGLGKSHLTHAVAHQIINSAPGTRLYYLTAQQLTGEMVKAIQNKSMNQFKNKYQQQCDVLLIDDIQSLEGRAKTQIELAETLDFLLDRGKRIIMTSSMAPREIPNINPDLRSRFTSGLITTINPPDQETRIQIIKRKAQNYQLALKEEQILFLADQVKGDIRRIKSVIVGLKAQCGLLKAQPDLTLIKETLENVIGRQNNLTAETIRDFIAAQFKVSINEICSKSRKKSITFPRQISMYLARKYTNQPLVDIGKAMNRDHSTVVHSVRVITEQMARNGSVRGQIELISDKLQKKFL